MKAAGLYSASVSIDGLERTHDLMRACRGSFASATAALGHLRAAGVLTASNFNINRLNAADLEGVYDHLAALGISSWQVQITAPPVGRPTTFPSRSRR
jgi:MoaA/NifB/PqqE/SkfB family radical SAM enzyme